MTFTMTIDDIDCEVEVTYYEAGDPGRTWGPPENCWPPEPSYIEYDLYVDGERADWLHERVTGEDELRILTKYEDYCRERAYDHID